MLAMRERERERELFTRVTKPPAGIPLLPHTRGSDVLNFWQECQLQFRLSRVCLRGADGIACPPSPPTSKKDLGKLLGKFTFAERESILLGSVSTSHIVEQRNF